MSYNKQTEKESRRIALSSNLKQLRSWFGISQIELERRASTTMVRHLEAGTKDPSVETLFALKNALNLRTIDELHARPKGKRVRR